jgi:hypothetical protein
MRIMAKAMRATIRPMTAQVMVFFPVSTASALPWEKTRRNPPMTMKIMAAIPMRENA